MKSMDFRTQLCMFAGFIKIIYIHQSVQGGHPMRRNDDSVWNARYWWFFGFWYRGFHFGVKIASGDLKKKLFTKPNKSTQGHLKMFLWASRIKYLCLLVLLGSYLSKKVNNIAVRCVEMILESQTRDRCDFWIIMSPPRQFLVPKKRTKYAIFCVFLNFKAL